MYKVSLAYINTHFKNIFVYLYKKVDHDTITYSTYWEQHDHY